MIYIRTIIALPVLYISLAPDQFFRCYNFYRYTVKLIIFCMLIPAIINGTKAIYRVENNINKIIVLKHLCQPAAVGKFNTVAFIRKELKYPGILAWLAKNIQV